MAASPYSHLRGRDLQLATLDRHLSEADAGTGSVVIFEGGAGLGKTTLLRAAVAAASGKTNSHLVREGLVSVAVPGVDISDSGGGAGGASEAGSFSFSCAARRLRLRVHASSSSRKAYTEPILSCRCR